MRRREFLKTVTASALVTPCAALADGSYEGTVLGGDKPLADVVVTDGLNCTLTDAHGKFRLPKRPSARFLSVTVPSGWRAADRHYRAVTEKSFEFHLVRWQESAGAGCSFLQIADSETNNMTWVPRLSRLAAEEHASFVVHTGDICSRIGMEAHAKGCTDRMVGRPVYYCVGNHDLVSEKYGEELFEQLFGPCWYSFDAGHVHFVVTPMSFGDKKPSYTHAMVADWLRNDLAYVPKGRPVVVFNHMISHDGSPSECGRLFASGSATVNLTTSCNLAAFVYGHVHHAYFRRRSGVALIASSSSCKGGIPHDPTAFRLVRVAPDGRTVAKSLYVPTEKWTSLKGGAAWSTDLGAPVYRASPVLDGDFLYVATLDDDGLGTGAVVALSAADGKVVWKTPMATSVRGELACFRGRVYAQDVDGHVVALDGRTGRTLWRHDLPASGWRPVFAGLAVDREKGILYAGAGERLCALSADTGKPVWAGPQGWKDGGEPLNTCCAVGSGVLVSPAQWRGLHANDAATGAHLWFSKDQGEFFCGAVPLIEGPHVCVLVGKRFNEYDLKTGKLVRTRELSASVQLPTGILHVAGKYVFGSWNGLQALDEKTLEPVWRISVGEALVTNASYSEGGGLVSAAPVAVDAESGVLAAQDGTVRLFRFADGSVIRSWKTGAPYFATPAVRDGRLYAADFAGAVRAFALGQA